MNKSEISLLNNEFINHPLLVLKMTARMKMSRERKGGFLMK